MLRTIDRHVVYASLAMLVVLLSWSVPAPAQQARDLESLAKELDELKQGQAALLKELRELRGMLTRQAPQGALPREVALTIGDSPVKGEKLAPVTIVEFFDYQCPFCARHTKTTFPQIERDYIATGKVKYVLRDLPIEGLHPQAFKGHEAARCAADQGRVWEMHERLIANQKSMALDALTDHAQALGLDTTAFRTCIESGKHAAAVRAEAAEATKLGISGTPTFLIGRTDGDGAKTTLVGFVRGAQSYEQFKHAIDTVLQSATKAGDGR